MPYPTYEDDYSVRHGGLDCHQEYAIRTRAYQLWEAAGRPEGHDAMGRPWTEQFWFKAQSEIAKSVAAQSCSTDE